MSDVQNIETKFVLLYVKLQHIYMHNRWNLVHSFLEHAFLKTFYWKLILYWFTIEDFNIIYLVDLERDEIISWRIKYSWSIKNVLILKYMFFFCKYVMRNIVGLMCFILNGYVLFENTNSYSRFHGIRLSGRYSYTWVR